MKRALIENAILWLVANVVLFFVLDEQYSFLLGPILTAAGMLGVTLIEVGVTRWWRRRRQHRKAATAKPG